MNTAAGSARAQAWALKDQCYAAWNSEPARAAQAAESLRHLAAQDNAAPEEQVEIQALADWTAGIACLTRAQMQEAVGHFEAAHAAFQRLGQPHHAAMTQVPCIAALSMLGRHETAIERAAHTSEALLAAGDRLAAAKVNLNLGSLHLRRDAPADAAHHYRQAAVLFARVGDREHSVMADIGLAGALTLMGDMAEALRICARAGMRARQHALPVLAAVVDESEALLHLARGAWREALAGLERSRASYQALEMPQYLAVAERQLADAYAALRLLPEAVRLYEPALQRFEALSMPDEQAWTRVQLGRAQAQLGDPGSARAQLARAAALFAGQANQVGTAVVALAGAELALAQGQPLAALRQARQAMAGHAAAGMPEGEARAAALALQALGQARRWRAAARLGAALRARAQALQLRPVEIACLTEAGLGALALGRPEAADAAFAEAIEAFEEQQATLPDEGLRSAFVGAHLRPYRERLRLALARGNAREVLQRLDRFRARSLDLGLAAADLAADDDDDITRQLRAQAAWLLRQLQSHQEEGRPLDSTHEELRRTEARLLEHRRRARLTVDGQAGPRRLDAELDLPALQTLLGPHDALVTYGRVDDEVFACVLRHDAVHLCRGLSRAAEVDAALEGLRFQADALRHGLAPVRAHLPRLAARMQARLTALHHLLWRGLEPSLADVTRVLLVPDAALAGVPFAALQAEGEAEPVGARFEFALAPSARRALHSLRRRPVAARSALVLADATRLPLAAVEARAVAALYPQAELALDAEATLATLRQRAARADVLHLACHAQFRADSPMFSALHLADAPLTVEAARGLALREGTVVLSACETAVAAHGAGDDAVGLVGAFLAGGAARVIASLWPVDDAVTARAMTVLHQALRDGATPARAVQRMQAALREEHAHAALWAAFVVHGGW